MPSFAIHLAVARRVAPARSALYFIGALAPDAMDYPAKEHAHLRYEADRAAALAQLARATNPGDDFAEGVLVHLYTDWLWDETQLQAYRNEMGADDPMWFKRYQKETGLASSWLYWNEPWAAPLLEAMLAVPLEGYGLFAGISPEKIHGLMRNWRDWLSANPVGPSGFYQPEIVEEFVKTTANNYITWRSNAC